MPGGKGRAASSSSKSSKREKLDDKNVEELDHRLKKHVDYHRLPSWVLAPGRRFVRYLPELNLVLKNDGHGRSQQRAKLFRAVLCNDVVLFFRRSHKKRAKLGITPKLHLYPFNLPDIVLETLPSRAVIVTCSKINLKVCISVAYTTAATGEFESMDGTHSAATDREKYSKFISVMSKTAARVNALKEEKKRALVERLEALKVEQDKKVKQYRSLVSKVKNAKGGSGVHGDEDRDTVIHTSAHSFVSVDSRRSLSSQSESVEDDFADEDTIAKIPRATTCSSTESPMCTAERIYISGGEGGHRRQSISSLSSRNSPSPSTSPPAKDSPNTTGRKNLLHEIKSTGADIEISKANADADHAELPKPLTPRISAIKVMPEKSREAQAATVSSRSKSIPTAARRVMKNLSGHVFRFTPDGLPTLTRYIVDARKLMGRDPAVVVDAFLETHVQIETMCSNSAGISGNEILEAMRKYAVLFQMLEEKKLVSRIGDAVLQHIIEGEGWLYHNAAYLVEEAAEQKGAASSVAEQRNAALEAMGGESSNAIYIPRKHRRVRSRAEYMNEVLELRKTLEASRDF